MISTIMKKSCRVLVPTLKRAFSSYPSHVVVNMPALSPTMTSGTIGKWLVEKGSSVSAGDAIADIETDKAAMAFEAQDDFFVAKLLVDTGVEIQCGTPIMVSVEDEEDINAFDNFVAESAPTLASDPTPVPVEASAPSPAPTLTPAPAPSSTPAPTPIPVVADVSDAGTSTPSIVPAVDSPGSAPIGVFARRYSNQDPVAKTALAKKLAADQIKYNDLYGRSLQKPISV